MKAGTRVSHRRFGRGTVQPYIDFDGTTQRSDMYKEMGIVFVEFDCPLPNEAKVMQVDVESLRLLKLDLGFEVIYE